MIDKTKLSPGIFLVHQQLGLVKFTEQCAFMETKNQDPTSLFVEDYEGIKEVSLNQLHIDEENM